MDGWQDVVTLVLLLFGSALMVIGGIGMLRMPDLFLRMSAATKVSTMGVMSLLAAVAVYFAETSVTIQAIATIAFTLLTAPVGAHIIGRAALNKEKVDLFEGTIVDEFSRDPEP